MDSHRKIDPVLAAKQGRLPLGLDEPSSEPGVTAVPAVVAAPVPAVPVSEPVVVHAVAPVAATVAVEAASIMPMTDSAKPDAGAAAPAAPEPEAAPVPVAAPAVPKMLTPRVSPIRKSVPFVSKAAGGMAPTPAVGGNRPMSGGNAGAGLQAEAGGAVLGAPRVVFTLGRVVRDHREKAGLDIPGLCQKTKVPKDFLENLEANRLEALPPPVYAKSYLRLLCREFAMDPAPCLEEYGRVQAARQGEAAAAPFTLTSEDRETGAKVGYAPRQTQPKPEKKSAMLKKLNPALIAVGVVVVGLILFALIALVVNRGSAHKATAGAAGATAAAPAAGDVDLDKFITPQQLPMKELPVPGR